MFLGSALSSVSRSFPLFLEVSFLGLCFLLFQSVIFYIIDTLLRIPVGGKGWLLRVDCGFCV